MSRVVITEYCQFRFLSLDYWRNALCWVHERATPTTIIKTQELQVYNFEQ